MAEPNAANVVNGPGILYIAPAATAFPSLASLPVAAGWTGASFVPVGYTDAGVEFSVTPSVKEIMADETITPIKQIITSVKVEIKVTLMESHIENIQRAIAMATLTNPGAGIKTLSLGSGNPIVEYALGFQGPGPGGATDRVVTVWRVNVISTVAWKSQRADVSRLDVTFSALSDSTKAVGRDVFEIVDFGAGS